MPIAVGYIRKSSIKEGERTYSIQTQREEIERVCRENGYELQRIYQDAAEGMNFSGMFEDNRPAWLQMQADIARGGIEAIVVYAIDRLSRNTEHMLKFIALLKKHHVVLLSYREPGLEFDSAAGELQIAIMAAVGSFEARRGGERMKSMIHKRQREGYFFGLVPFGYDRDADGNLTPNADADTVRKAVDLYVGGATLRDIEYYCQEHRLTICSPVTGYTRRPIVRTSLHVILSNHWLYRGYVALDTHSSRDPNLRYSHNEANPPPNLVKSDRITPILSETQAVAIAESLRRRSRSGPRNKKGTHTGLLTGVIFCRHCGKRLQLVVTTYPNRKLKRDTYNYYYHDKTSCPGEFGGIRQDVIEPAVISKLADIVIPELEIFRVKQILQTRRQRHSSEIVDTEKRQARVREAINRLNKMYQWGSIEDAEYLTETQRLRAELDQLQSHHPNELYDIDALAVEIKRISADLATALDIKTQQAIIREVIERVEVEKNTKGGWRIHLIPTPPWAAFWHDLIHDDKE